MVFGITILIPFFVSVMPFVLSAIIFVSDPHSPVITPFAIVKISQSNSSSWFADSYVFITVFAGAYLSVLVMVEFIYIYDSGFIHKDLHPLLIIVLFLDVITFVAIVVIGIGVDRNEQLLTQIPNIYTAIALVFTSLAALPASTAVVVAIRTHRELSNG